MFTASKEPQLSRRPSSTALTDQGRATFLLAGAQEEDPAIEGPNRGDSESQKRLGFGADPHEWQDDIRQHTAQVSNQPEQRDEHMLHGIVHRVLVESHHADNATKPVQQKCAEVR